VSAQAAAIRFINTPVNKKNGRMITRRTPVFAMACNPSGISGEAVPEKQTALCANPMPS
jgi:hypothetical protein